MAFCPPPLDKKKHFNCFAVTVINAKVRGGRKDKKGLKEQKYKYKQREQQRRKSAKVAQAQAKIARILKELTMNTDISTIMQKYRVSPKKIEKTHLKLLFNQLKRNMARFKILHPEFFEGQMKGVEDFINENAEKDEFDKDTITIMSLLSPIFNILMKVGGFCVKNPIVCVMGTIFFLAYLKGVKGEIIIQEELPPIRRVKPMSKYFRDRMHDIRWGGYFWSSVDGWQGEGLPEGFIEGLGKRAQTPEELCIYYSMLNVRGKLKEKMSKLNAKHQEQLEKALEINRMYRCAIGACPLVVDASYPKDFRNLITILRDITMLLGDTRKTIYLMNEEYGIPY